MEYESSSWIRDGVYYYPHLFGGIMLTCALLSFSTNYFGMIGVPAMPYLFPDLRIFHKKKCAKKRVRVYMDGCFDLMHYGHANALRQAKALGDELIVGVVSDEEIIANKGPPVLSMQERLALVSGLKWVDEVIPNAPYEISQDFMNRLFNEHKIDFVIHGDDPCLLPDGTDAYAQAKKAGRYKQIKRTEGVSSTDIVGRILSSMKDVKAEKDSGESANSENTRSNKVPSNGGHISRFLPTSRRIVQFANDKVSSTTSCNCNCADKVGILKFEHTISLLSITKMCAFVNFYCSWNWLCIDRTKVKMFFEVPLDVAQERVEYRN